jgi:hypothetical protein
MKMSTHVSDTTIKNNEYKNFLKLPAKIFSFDFATLITFDMSKLLHSVSYTISLNDRLVGHKPQN